MKKIFLFLFLVFSYNLFAACAPNSVHKVTYYATYNYPNGTSNFKQVYYPYAPWYGYFYLVTDDNPCALNIPNNTSQNCRIDKKGVLHCVEPDVPFPSSFDDNGNFQVLPNPDPLQDPSGRCRSLYQKDGQAYSCNPDSNEATLIPNSDGVTIDPEDGRDIPNCKSGYTWSSMGAGGTNTNASPTHTVYSCVPSSSTGSGLGNTGGSTNPNVGTVTNPNGTTTTTLPDGTTHTYYPSSQTTVTRYPSGEEQTTYHNNSNGGTDSGSGSSTGGTDSGSGSSTGGTSGTGTTGGTTGTNTGTGTSGGTTGTTDGGSPGGTSSSGGVGSTSTTGGTGSTGGTTGTNTGTGSPGGTTGTNTGTGTSGGTTTTTPPTTEIADNCSDASLTLEQKQLCISNSKLTTANAKLSSIDSSLSSIKNLLTPLDSVTSNPLDGSDSLITGVIGEYTSFKNNIVAQGDTLKTLVYTSIDTVNQGFNFNISSNEVINCPKNYELILSALNMPNMTVTLDICEQTSKLKPYFYPMFLIMFSVMTTILTFRMLGVLL